MEIERFLQECLEKKSVDNPAIRSQDPTCWSCLSDEQRDIIHEWYISRIIEKDKERKQTERKETIANCLSLIPFAVFYGVKHCGDMDWKFVVFSIIAWIFYSFIYFVANQMYKLFIHNDDYVWKTICVTLGIIIATLAVLGRVYR